MIGGTAQAVTGVRFLVITSDVRFYHEPFSIASGRKSARDLHFKVARAPSPAFRVSITYYLLPITYSSNLLSPLHILHNRFRAK